MSRRLFAEIAAVAGAVLVALFVRGFVASPYAIPSESMLPSLLVGDILLAEKWPIRLEHRLAERGDVIVFRAPPSGRQVYVKRLIGLPGDRIAMRGGVIVLNGREVPRWRVADLVLPAGRDAPRRFPRYREMLPGGRTWSVIDFGFSDGDDRAEIVVPPDRLFVLGDNRDRSADSRYPARDGGAVGLVPTANLIGRARFVLLSTDGSFRWTRPSTWHRAIRRERTGRRL